MIADEAPVRLGLGDLLPGGKVARPGCAPIDLPNGDAVIDAGAAAAGAPDTTDPRVRSRGELKREDGCGGRDPVNGLGAELGRPNKGDDARDGGTCVGGIVRGEARKAKGGIGGEGAATGQGACGEGGMSMEVDARRGCGRGVCTEKSPGDRDSATERDCGDPVEDLEGSQENIVVHQSKDTAGDHTVADASSGDAKPAGLSGEDAGTNTVACAACEDSSGKGLAPSQAAHGSQDGPSVKPRTESSAGGGKPVSLRWADMSMTDDEEDWEEPLIESLKEPDTHACSTNVQSVEKPTQVDGQREPSDGVLQTQSSHRILDSHQNVITAWILPASKRRQKAQNSAQQKGGSEDTARSGSGKHLQSYPKRTPAAKSEDAIDSQREDSNVHDGRPGGRCRSMSAEQGLFQCASRGRSSLRGRQEGPRHKRGDSYSSPRSGGPGRQASNTSSSSDGGGRKWTGVDSSISQEGPDSPNLRQAKKEGGKGGAEHLGRGGLGGRGQHGAGSADRRRSPSTGARNSPGRQPTRGRGHKRAESTDSGRSWSVQSEDDVHSPWNYVGKMRMDMNPESRAPSQCSDQSFGNYRGRLRRQRGAESGRAGPERASSSQSWHSIGRPASSQSSRNGSPRSCVTLPEGSGRGWSRQRPFDAGWGANSRRGSGRGYDRRDGWPSPASQGRPDSTVSARSRDGKHQPPWARGGGHRHRRNYSEGADVNLALGGMSHHERELPRGTTLRRHPPELQQFPSRRSGHAVASLNPDAKPFVPLQTEAK
eukprot:evm.model.scf_819.3 EVM.evm.TU.scf_819.3   scf_819:16482-19148(+)